MEINYCRNRKAEIIRGTNVCVVGRRPEVGIQGWGVNKMGAGCQSAAGQHQAQITRGGAEPRYNPADCLFRIFYMERSPQKEVRQKKRRR